MRAIKQVMTAKQKSSKFFDYFLKKYGDSCTATVAETEIVKNLRSFYTDLIYGNVQQQKYMQYLYSDPRIVQVAINDSQNKVTKAWVRVESMKFAQASGFQATLNEVFPIALNEDTNKLNIYSSINRGLINFLNSGDINHLIQISLYLNNAMNRGLKIEL